MSDNNQPADPDTLGSHIGNGGEFDHESTSAPHSDLRMHFEMNEQEQARYDAIVHALRMKGWSRIEAEGEALECIDFARQLHQLDLARSEFDDEIYDQ